MANEKVINYLLEQRERAEFFRIVVAGASGMGKTYFIRNILLTSMLSLKFATKNKVLVVDIDNNPYWEDLPEIYLHELAGHKSGMCRLKHDSIIELFEYLNKYVHDTIIIFEDTTKYLDPTIPKPVERNLLALKQLRNIAIYTFHGLIDVPNKIAKSTDAFILFKTKEFFSTYVFNKYRRSEDMKRAFEIVDKFELKDKTKPRPYEIIVWN